MTLPVIVIGGGGHAKVLIDVLRLNGIEIFGIAVSNDSLKGQLLSGIRVIGNDNDIFMFHPDSVSLLNGIGSIGLPTKREDIFNQFQNKGFRFVNIIHPSAIVASDVTLGNGVQIMAGTIIQPGSRIGTNTILNTKASVDHDCIIGDHVHLAPGVTLSGGVTVGTGVHIGTGATVIQGVHIGDRSLIGAGSIVLKNVSQGSKIMSIHAREGRL